MRWMRAEVRASVHVCAIHVPPPSGIIEIYVRHAGGAVGQSVLQAKPLAQGEQGPREMCSGALLHLSCLSCLL